MINSFKFPICALASLILCATAHSQTVQKHDWLDQMPTALPVAFCQPNTWYRQCFSVTAQRCEQVAASASRVCASKHSGDMPDVLQQPVDGRKWGEIIGNCAGTTYASTLQSEFLRTDKCSNSNNWMQ